MISFYEENASEKLREALRNVDAIGKLDTLAAVSGIAGGEPEIRKIMNSTGEINVMDIGMLGIHL
jgi:hypothetical protein